VSEQLNTIQPLSWMIVFQKKQNKPQKTLTRVNRARNININKQKLEATPNSTQETSNTGGSIMTTETVVKRGPGRPRKNPEAVTPAPVVKRGPGRPRKNPEAVNPEAVTPEPVVKRGPGRPRKNPEAITSTPVAKRGPGRPRKNPEATAAPVVKRGPGRPKGSKNKPKVTATTATTATAPVVKRGPGRPRKNPEAVTMATVKRGPGRPRKNPEVVTITSTSKTVAKSGNTRQVLVNPFREGDIVNIPAGSVFTSSAPTLKGRQKVKRGHKVTVVDTIPAHVQPRNSETGSKVLIRPSRIRAKGSGSYWKDITLTEKILKFNGMNATYETVNVGNVIVEATAEPREAVVTASEPSLVGANTPMFSEDV
jgi:hypothetical protein